MTYQHIPAMPNEVVNWPVKMAAATSHLFRVGLPSTLESMLTLSLFCDKLKFGSFVHHRQLFRSASELGRVDMRSVGRFLPKWRDHGDMPCKMPAKSW